MTNLDDARLRADVEVVVTGLIRPGELGRWTVRWFAAGQAPDYEPDYSGGFTMRGGPDPDSSTFWVQVIADDELWWFGAWQPDMDWPEFLGLLADELSAWISETSFGWGELRIPTLPV
ncbi:MAG: hypothetical protein NTX33_07315 [Propionibacteriales bacterium]|nr:hypothetical protein [Propionibacteriales bacterium]